MLQFRETLLRLFIILFFPLAVFSQSTFLPQDSKYAHFLERMEILLQTNPDLNVSTVKPLSRKLAVQNSEISDSLHHFYPFDYFYHLSPVDQYYLHDLLMNNIEWVKSDTNSFKSKHPLFDLIYTNKANFFEARDKDFFLVVDPVVQLTESYQTNNSERVFLNEKGLTLRGMIGDKIGFSSFLTDNQERGPVYFQQRVTASGYPAVPGAGYWQTFKQTGFDYFDNRASIYFNALKYFDFQFGYDKNFIGDGYRSLFLSDYSAPYLFLKWNTRIWKLDYQNIYMELISQHQLGNYEYPKKYAVIHDLSLNLTQWLNVGLYENIVFSRANHFDFSYLNPVIFLVSAQQQTGSPDKSMVGLDFKANAGHVVQFYGQLLIDEFILGQIEHYSLGNWANKQGLQLGVKYIDAFDIKNLDFQFEANLVRPFCYSSHDTVSNFSNYNQPLAHPLGANFDEFIVIGRYQPKPKWNIEGKFIFYRQGIDSTANDNYGSNILKDYDTRSAGDYGYKIGSGLLTNCVNTSILVSYEIKENLFIDASALYRDYVIHDAIHTVNASATYTLGIRMNMWRRQYDY